jgi:type I restriction enzyme, S subunit
MSVNPKMTFNDVLIENSNKVPVETTTSFPMAGIYSYARGLFAKADIMGSDTAYKVLHQIKDRQLVLSRLKGWEGAVALAEKSTAGRFLPPHNLMFDINEKLVDPDYLGWVIKQPQLWAALKGASRGMGARRETVSADDLLSYELPLPALAEQRRIVARLKTASEMVDRIKKLHAGLYEDLAALVVRANETYQARSFRLEEALDLEENRVAIEPGGTYPQAGIRGFGGGLFEKEAVSASHTMYRHFNRLEAGQFVVSQVKGWEGAVSVCDEQHAGLFVSPEYRTFRCDPGVLRSTYFAYLCRTPWFHTKLAPATRGQGARRERLRPEMLLALSIPLPLVEVQIKLEDMFKRAEAAIRTSTAAQLDHLIPAMLHGAFATGSLSFNFGPPISGGATIA